MAARRGLPQRWPREESAAMSVETSHGHVEGTRQQGVELFFAIPYAAAPMGERRWGAPLPSEPWAGVRACTRPGLVAPQPPGLVSRLFGVGGEQAAEDCLLRNVATPACDGARRPVMVWLHGGGFTSGSGTLPVYDAGALARRGDVVVVDEVAGNFGLLDQLAALEWVRDNVAAFGGDPDNVTLFGQSAGAMCASALLGAPCAAGLFRRAILQSGAARHVRTSESAARVTEVFCQEAGVATGDRAALRGLPVEALLAAQGRCLQRLARELPDPPLEPVVDGQLLPEPPLEAVAAGRVPALPLLIGTNLDEWRFYGLGDPKAASLDEAGLLRRFGRGLPGRDRSGRSLAERVVETYRAARAGRESIHPRDLWFAIQTDRWFRHPATRLAETRARHQPATHAYLFRWRSPALGGALGACHALDVPFVFGSLEHPGVRDLVGDGAGAARLSDTMQGAWLAFARGQLPGHPELPDWPAYEAERRATMILGPECSVALAPAECERAFWDEIAAEGPAGMIGP
jgi:para-nitrobenzyl esterase